MNKLLYISNYRNLSGYSYAGENNLKALHYAGYDVAARNINLTPKTRKLDDLTEKLLKKDASDCNISLIHSLPSFFQYDGRFKLNIGYFDYETYLVGTNWLKYCEFMDKIWVPSQFMKNILCEIDGKVDVVPHPVDINRFNKSAPPDNWFRKYKKDTGNYLFYTISEFGPRKNYEGLLKAWHFYFRNSDKADLILKIHKAGFSDEQLKNEIVNLNEFVKKSTRISNKYLKNPIIITEDWNETQIDMLHREADCFVNASHGEAWSYPTLDACCFGKPVIAGNYGGYLDYLDNTNSVLVNGRLEPIYGYMDSMVGLYNGENHWFALSFGEFGFIMRDMLLRRDQGVSLGKVGSLLAEKFNYYQVGKHSKQLLDSYFP